MMMQKIKIIYTFIIIAISIISCNETPVEIPEYEVPKSNRVVLIEDLTGVRCPNCPKGAAAIDAIKLKYSNQIAIIGIHGNLLTKPHADSKYDFRNPKAIALEEYLKPFLGKPAANINRRFFDGEIYTSVDQVDLWQSYVEKELLKPQEMEIAVTKSYNQATRLLNLNVTAAALINESGTYKISVYITENKLIDPQETQGSIIKNYEHNHVLRDMLTDAKGDDFGSSLVKNQSVIKSYSYAIPAQYETANMEAVVMISRVNGNERSVLQAFTLKL
jgi:hypothetical protein